MRRRIRCSRVWGRYGIPARPHASPRSAARSAGPRGAVGCLSLRGESIYNTGTEARKWTVVLSDLPLLVTRSGLDPLSALQQKFWFLQRHPSGNRVYGVASVHIEASPTVSTERGQNAPCCSVPGFARLGCGSERPPHMVR